MRGIITYMHDPDPYVASPNVISSLTYENNPPVINIIQKYFDIFKTSSSLQIVKCLYRTISDTNHINTLRYIER